MITDKTAIPFGRLLKIWLLTLLAMFFCLGLYNLASAVPMFSLPEEIIIYFIQGSVSLVTAFWALSTIGVYFRPAFHNFNASIKKDLKLAFKYFFIYALAAVALIGLIVSIAVVLMKMGLFDMAAFNRSSAVGSLRQPELAYLHNMVIGSPFKFILYLFATCILIPIEEEIFHRRLLYVSLRNKLPFLSSLLISSLIFGLGHMPVASAISAFVVGLFLGWIYEKTQNLSVNIMVHGLINFSVTMVLVFLALK